MPVKGFFTKKGKKHPISSRKASFPSNTRVENAKRIRMIQEGNRSRIVVNGITVSRYETEDGDIRFKLRAKNGNWMSISEDEEDNIAWLTKDFARQWEARVGQYQD